VLSPGSAEANVGCGGKLNGRLMASCVMNISTKNNQNQKIAFQVTVKNVGMFYETQCITSWTVNKVAYNIGPIF